MLSITDQMKRTIRLEAIPRRIVSLVPSQTELLYDLGCDESVVGITKFCIHPNSWYRSKKRVGGTKNINFDALKALKPDLIIANKEENSKEDIEALCDEYPVYISDIFTVEDALEMISQMGLIVNKNKKATELISRIQKDFQELPKFNGKVLYFIWSNPYMVVGPNTFIGHLIERLGFENAIADKTKRYQEISHKQILELAPESLLLSSEPFPFKTDHVEEMNEFFDGHIQLVDGEMFSWYGSRMLKMKQYFQGLSKEF